MTCGETVYVKGLHSHYDSGSISRCTIWYLQAAIPYLLNGDCVNKPLSSREMSVW